MKGYRAKAFAAIPPKCGRCGFAGDDVNPLEVHHVDVDHSNHDVANLEILCRRCHRRGHRRSTASVGPSSGAGWVRAYIADPELFRFAKSHAAHLRMTVSAYINFLLEIDRAQDIAREEVMLHIWEPVETGEAAAS